MQKLGKLAWSVLIISISLTFTIWVGTFYSIFQSENQNFQDDTYLMTMVITDELEDYEQVLTGAQGLFAASHKVELSEWRSFINAKHIETKFPGLQGVGYVQYILHEDRQMLIDEMTSYGYDSFDIKPAGDRDEYYPVIFLEPLDIRNQQAIGYDIYFEQTRRDAVNALIETGTTTLTGKIILVQEIDEHVQNGFLMLVPVYSNENPDSLQGIVYNVFRINAFIQNNVDDYSFEHLRLKIYDSHVSDENLFFNSDDITNYEFGNPDFSKSIPTSIGNRDWIFVYEGLENISTIDATVLIAIPIVGFSMSGLMFYVLRLVAKNLILSKSVINAEKVSAMGTMASRLSHDLRNPLTVIKANLDLLSRNLGTNLDEKSKQFVKRMYDSAESMTTIIEDVLQFSRTAELQIEYSSIIELLKNAVANIEIPNRIKITLPEDDYALNCDKTKLRSVFSNLITNSIQSIENNGTITVSIKDEDEFLSISFKDSGSGIPDDVISKIFEPLFTTKVSGTGLGLGICKNIVEQHGGTITVTNNPTTFTIKLPKNVILKASTYENTADANSVFKKMLKDVKKNKT